MMIVCLSVISVWMRSVLISVNKNGEKRDIASSVVFELLKLVQFVTL